MEQAGKRLRIFFIENEAPEKKVELNRSRNGVVCFSFHHRGFLL